MDKNKKAIMISVVLFIISIIYIILVKNVDVASIGPQGSEVGFSSINAIFQNSLGYNEIWYKITKYLGVIPFLIVAYYGLIGILQLTKRKSIMKVDKKIICMGAFYVLLGMTYVLFEKLVINYRPVMLEGELEASFPSSHTLLSGVNWFSDILGVVIISLFLVSIYYTLINLFPDKKKS